MDVTFETLRSYKRVYRGPCLKLTFSVKKKTETQHGEYGRGLFTIENLVEIRVQFYQNTLPASSSNMPAPLPITISISVRKLKEGKHSKVKLKANCLTTNFSNQIVCSDTWTDWIAMGIAECVYEDSMYVLQDLQINFSVSKSGSVTFADLYDDTDIVDFKLRFDDSTISVHKACLAAHSTKFKAMLATDWKDATEGNIEVEGMTHQTLRFLKDYMYLGVVPDTDLRPFLLLAEKYSMENLKNDCIAKMVETVEFHNLYSLLEFACKNNIPELSFALMLQTSDDVVNNAYELRNNIQLQDQVDSDNLNISNATLLVSRGNQ